MVWPISTALLSLFTRSRQSAAMCEYSGQSWRWWHAYFSSSSFVFLVLIPSQSAVMKLRGIMFLNVTICIFPYYWAEKWAECVMGRPWGPLRSSIRPWVLQWIDLFTHMPHVQPIIKEIPDPSFIMDSTVGSNNLSLQIQARQPNL